MLIILVREIRLHRNLTLNRVHVGRLSLYPISTLNIAYIWSNFINNLQDYVSYETCLTLEANFYLSSLSHCTKGGERVSMLTHSLPKRKGEIVCRSSNLLRKLKRGVPWSSGQGTRKRRRIFRIQAHRHAIFSRLLTLSLMLI